jgi:hypothetical protein
VLLVVGQLASWRHHHYSCHRQTALPGAVLAAAASAVSCSWQRRLPARHGLSQVTPTSSLALPALLLSCVACFRVLQLIVQLAREADKDGRRTIGVLTKADMIEPGTHDTWLPVLQVRRERHTVEVELGCAVTAQYMACTHSTWHVPYMVAPAGLWMCV